MTAKEFKAKYEKLLAEYETNTDGTRGKIVDGSGTYFGKITDGKRQGFGIMFYKNGDYYEGHWVNNVCHGGGFLDCADNRRYEGTFLFGELRDGEISQPYGDNYNGECKNGRPHGKGIMLYADGRGYDGSWDNGKFHGIGRYWYPNYLKVYHGTWVEGKKEGRFTELLRNGRNYIVFFKDDKRHGTEILYDARGNTTVGNWVEGNRVGDFIKTDKDGKKYRLVYGPETYSLPTEEPIEE